MKLVPVLGALVLLGLPGCATHPVSEADAQKFRATLDQRDPEFTDCYRKHGEKKDVYVAIKYERTFAGQISFASIDSDLTTGSNPVLDACMVDALKKIVFPPTEGGDAGYGTVSFRYSYQRPSR